MKTLVEYQVEHLIKQNKKHGKLLIAFDYDDTVMPLNFPEEFCIRPRALLLRAQNAGHTLILYSFNTEHWAMVEQCGQLKLKGMYLGCSPVHSAGSKIFYNLFLDDKCGLNEACDILEMTLDKLGQ